MKKLLVATALVASILYGWRWVSAHHISPGNGPCAAFHSDVNRDCIVNSGDLGFVSHHFGTTIPTFTPTPTPTDTPTPTNTPVPTATNTPTSYTVNDLLGQTGELAGNAFAHDGTLCTGGPPGGVSGFDWQFHGRAGAATSSRPAIAMWGTAQWQNCHVTQPNTFVEFRNLKTYALTGAGWELYAGQNDPFNWCGNMDVDTFTYRGACTRFGNTYQMPTGSNAWVVHWGESDETKKAGAVCHVSLFEARVVGGGSVMANSGLDFRENNQSFGDSWFGSYVLLTDTFKQIGGTSCTAAQLNPPPPGVQ